MKGERVIIMSFNHLMFYTKNGSIVDGYVIERTYYLEHGDDIYNPAYVILDTTIQSMERNISNLKLMIQNEKNEKQKKSIERELERQTKELGDNKKIFHDIEQKIIRYALSLPGIERRCIDPDWKELATHKNLVAASLAYARKNNTGIKEGRDAVKDFLSSESN